MGTEVWKLPLQMVAMFREIVKPFTSKGSRSMVLTLKFYSQEQFLSVLQLVVTFMERYKWWSICWSTACAFVARWLFPSLWYCLKAVLILTSLWLKNSGHFSTDILLFNRINKNYKTHFFIDILKMIYFLKKE